jgi:hypothetical protein
MKRGIDDVTYSKNIPTPTINKKVRLADDLLNDVEEERTDNIEKDGLEYGGGDKSEGTFTPFNLNEIRQLGNIDKTGEFTWTRRTVGEEDKEHAHDAWLKDSKTLSKEEIEVIEQKKNLNDKKNKANEREFNKNELLKILECHLNKFETVSEGLKRLGKQSNISSAKKKKKSWRDKKKKISLMNNNKIAEENVAAKKSKDSFFKLTSATTELLIEGSINNIYQFSREQISKLIEGRK